MDFVNLIKQEASEVKTSQCSTDACKNKYDGELAVEKNDYVADGGSQYFTDSDFLYASGDV